MLKSLRKYWESVALFSIIGFFALPMSLWLGSLVIDHAQPIKGSEWLIPYTPWLLILIIVVLDSCWIGITIYSYYDIKSDSRESSLKC